MHYIEVLKEFSDTNTTCPFSLLWDQAFIDNEQPILYICIVASIIHSMFWSQLIFFPALRSRSMQWLYSYLTTDILLLFRFFFLYIVHIKSYECISNFAWYFFICYSEAILDNYLNTIEAYILLALNICRYIQIVHNRNVYRIYVRSMVCAHLTIYLVPVIGFIVELAVGWAQIRVFTGESCDVAFTNKYIQTFNVICGFALPILLNAIVIYLNVRYVHLTSRLQRAQHHVSAREKYNRSLVIQFLVFYTVWLLLWSPNLIVYQFTIGASTLTQIVSLLSYIEINLDPIIIAALDVRFQKLWQNIWIRIKNIPTYDQRNHRRVSPNILFTTHAQRQVQIANVR